MSRSAQIRKPSLFERLATLRDRLAGLFRGERQSRKTVRLSVETMEERLVPTVAIMYDFSDSGGTGTGLDRTLVTGETFTATIEVARGVGACRPPRHLPRPGISASQWV